VAGKVYLTRIFKLCSEPCNIVDHNGERISKRVGGGIIKDVKVEFLKLKLKCSCLHESQGGAYCV